MISRDEPYLDEAADLLKLLGHPTRLAVLGILRGGEECVCHMEAILGLRQAHISQHLMALRQAGIVIDRRDGWNHFYRVVRPEVFRLIDAAFAASGRPGEHPARAEGGREPIVLRVRSAACPCPKCRGEASPAGFKGEERS